MADDTTAPDASPGQDSSSGQSGIPQSAPTQSTLGGMAANHPVAPPRSSANLAPSTGGEYNVIQDPPRPIACWKLEDVRFAFDSSLITIEAAQEVRALAASILQNTDTTTGQARKPLLSIFGHADPVGSDDYNKVLSGRRARAVYGLLTQQAAIWDALYSDSEGINDHWGDQALAYIRQSLNLPDGDTTPSHDLFDAYIKKIAGGFKADSATDFLGVANGGTPGGKADVQGCSEFNPVRLLPETEENVANDAPEAEQRNYDNSVNRRVVTFLFSGDTKITPANWPCPTTDQGKGGCATCRSRFWSDGDAHRAIGPTWREYTKKSSTYACRFYERIANDSPCDKPKDTIRITIKLLDIDDVPVVNTKYRLQVAGEELAGATDDQGLLRQTIPAGTTAGTLVLDQWNWGVTLQIQALASVDSVSGAKARLNNLGYFAGTSGDADDFYLGALLRFQTAYKLYDGTGNVTGLLDSTTQNKLKEIHGS